MDAPLKKIDRLRAFMRAGQWEKALKLAARFPRLGPYRGAILTASSALLSPGIYRSMGKDPAGLVKDGIAALKTAYPI